MSKDPRLYVLHILESIAHIERYIEGGQTVFLSDDMVRDAVLRRLQTLAESTQRLSDEVKARHPHIQWRQIAAFRNILVHDYLGDLDPILVWNAIQTGLSSLKQVMVMERESFTR